MNKNIVTGSLFLLAVLFALTSCGGGGGGGGGFLPGPTAKPGEFNLVSPSDGDTASLTPTLSWTASSHASRYTVQLDVASNPSFTTLIINETVTGTSIDLASHVTLTANEQYIWRVMSNNSKGITTAPSGSVSYYTFTAKDSGGVEWAVVSNPTGSDAEILSAASDTNYVYVAGYNETGATCNGYQCSQWRIEKRNASDGALVSAFGSGGVVSPDSTSEFDYISGIVNDDSSLYAVGIDIDNGWRIEKRTLTNGQLDGTFGAGEAVYSTPTLSYDTALAVAHDATSLYIVGYSLDGSGFSEEWRIEKRNLNDGLPVMTFNTGTMHAGSTSQARAIAVDGGNNVMYIAGEDESGWRIEKRTLDGSLVSEFTDTTDGPGVVHSVFGSANAIAIDGVYLYIVGNSSGVGNTALRIEKRSTVDGSLIASAIDGPNSFDDTLYAIAVKSPDFYVAGYDRVGSSDYEWRVEKRNLATLALVPSFGNNGVVTKNPSAGDDTAYAIAPDRANPYIYVAGYDSSPGGFEWRLEKIGQ